MGHRRINRGRQRRHELRERAKVIAEERANRTPIQQIKTLDDRLGVGIGATKERRRLKNLMETKITIKRKSKTKTKKGKNGG
tara:strand:- start:1777 stop:2022 length:246 start_codon:yes stop_codon:yes gene_type:complete